MPSHQESLFGHGAGGKPLQYVAPDRQEVIDGRPRRQRPKPVGDRETNSVDRLAESEDSVPHRFTIKRGDRAKVWLSSSTMACGEVVGISLARQEVGVSFVQGSGGIRFPVGCVYPMQPYGSRTGTPRSRIVEKASKAPAGGFTEVDRVAPCTIGELQEYQRRFHAGESTLAEHQAVFERMRSTRSAFVESLTKERNAGELKSLARISHRLGERQAASFGIKAFVTRALSQKKELAWL